MQRKEVVNRYISLILKLGTYSSVLILLLGFLLLVFFPTLREVKPFSFPELISGFLNLSPYAFINLGALILIITPVLRVIVAIISFSLEKDKRYVWISTGVLLILIGNMIFFSF